MKRQNIRKGTGQNHVCAVEENWDDLAILYGEGRSAADEQFLRCGRCTHHSEALHETHVSVDNPRLARFTPVG